MRQTMILTGDLMLRGVTDSEKPFSNVASVLQQADVVFGNLEGGLSGPEEQRSTAVDARSAGQPDTSQAPPLKARRYDAGPAAAEALGAAGFHAVGCANNVTFGSEAIEASLARLDELGIEHTGAGMDAGKARAPAIVERDGVRFGFLQYTCEFFPVGHEATDDGPGVAAVKAHTAYQPDPRIMERAGGPATVITWADPGYLKRMESDVAGLRPRVDVAVASFHWGLGRTNKPIGYQIEIAHAAIDAGADLVMGHGPHSVQAAEVYRGKPVLYSLGDFVEQVHGPGILVWVEVDGGEVARVFCAPVTRDSGGISTVRVPSAEPEITDTLLGVSRELRTELSVSEDRIVVWQAA